MKKLILLGFILCIYTNFSYANTSKTFNTCGSNIRDVIIICYDLKSYNKNSKISLEFGNGFGEQSNENPENYDWRIIYNLNAILEYSIIVNENKKIVFQQTFQELVPIDEEYELYNAIMVFNSRFSGDLIVKYGLLPENFHVKYSNELNKIINKYKNLDENNFEIKKSEYIINTLTPLLEPEKEKLKKIEDKRNSILGDDFNNYIKSIKNKNEEIIILETQKLTEELVQVKTELDFIEIKITNLEKDLNPKGLRKFLNNGYTPKKSQMEYDLKEAKNNYEKTEYKYKDIQNKIAEIQNNNQSNLLLEECSVAHLNKAKENSTNIFDAKDNYTYKHIESCYKEFIDDNSKLEMLHNIDNFYIKQHKKVQFIIDTIKENKFNIETIQKKIESEKRKQDLEKELS